MLTPQVQSKEFSDENAMKAMENMADKRASRTPLTNAEMRTIVNLLEEYLKSPSRRAHPSKAQLSAFTRALLGDGSRVLSPKWNKTQLATAIIHWLTAVAAKKPESQLETYLVISFHRDAPNVMEHQIKTPDDGDTFVEIMQTSSPSSRAQGSRVPILDWSPAAVSDVNKNASKDNGVEDMLEESPATFLEQFDQLLNDTELAPTPEENPGGGESLVPAEKVTGAQIPLTQPPVQGPAI